LTAGQGHPGECGVEVVALDQQPVVGHEERVVVPPGGFKPVENVGPDGGVPAAVFVDQSGLD
jgi:hypothetical protein